MTLAVPEDLHRLIKRHPEVRWSAIARASMWEYAKKLALLDELTAKSKLSDQDVEEIGRKVKAAIRRRHEAPA